MRIGVITSDGFGAPLAYKLREEGNEVKLFTREPEARDIYRGILDSEKEWKSIQSWADYGIFFNNKLDDIWEQWVKEKPAFGGSKAGQEAEKNRTEAHKRMKSLGIKVPESITFKTVAEAKSHLKEHKVRHFVKPTGGTTDSDDVVGSRYEDGRDAIAVLHRMEDLHKKFDQIEVEERIDGIEAGVAVYSDGQKIGDRIEINFQHKPLASGNFGNGIGPLTGEMGTLTKMVGKDNPFFKRTIAKLEPFLRSVNYRGEWDCGFIVNEKGDYFIEDTSRKGVPDFTIRWETQKTPEGELYSQIANGALKTYETGPEWAIGVVLVSPGFPDPDSSEKRSVGLPVLNFEENKQHCALFEVRKGKLGLEMSAGGYGYPAVVTGKGTTIEEARRNVYWILDERNPKKFDVPKSWWRDDIGQRVLNQKKDIIRLGILSEADFGS